MLIPFRQRKTPKTTALCRYRTTAPCPTTKCSAEKQKPEAKTSHWVRFKSAVALLADAMTILTCFATLAALIAERM